MAATESSSYGRGNKVGLTSVGPRSRAFLITTLDYAIILLSFQFS